MNKDATNRLMILLMGAILLLLIVNTSLFIRMNQLQSVITKIFDGMEQVETLKVGDPAPDFSLTDFEGHKINLNQFSGNKTLLVFSDVSCPHCQQFWPTLNRFHNSYPNLNILMISNGGAEENAKMTQEQSFDFPILPWDETVATNYKVPGTPYLVLLSTDQKVDLVGYSDALERIVAKISE